MSYGCGGRRNVNLTQVAFEDSGKQVKTFLFRSREKKMKMNKDGSSGGWNVHESNYVPSKLYYGTLRLFITAMLYCLDGLVHVLGTFHVYLFEEQLCVYQFFNEVKLEARHAHVI